MPSAATSAPRSTLQLLGGQVEQHLARGRGHACAAAAAMSGVVRLPNVPTSNGSRPVSAMTMRIDADGDAQLLGHRLRERRADVLADLDLAGVDGDRAVLADVQPGADLLRASRRRRRRAAAGLLGARPVGRASSDDEAAAERP